MLQSPTKENVMEKAPPVVIEAMEMAETPRSTRVLVCSARNIESAAFLRVSHLVPARAALQQLSSAASDTHGRSCGGRN